MAKGWYVGINGTARKVKKGYIGVDGVARKIKKAYIGIGGVARPCWSEEQKIVKYGAITNLSKSASEYKSGEMDNYALFLTSDSYPNLYDKSLTHSKMTKPFAGHASARAGKYLIVPNTSTSMYTRAIDQSLTVTNLEDYPVGLYGLCGGTAGDYAIFGGGRTDGDYDTTSLFVAYNSSLTRTNRYSPNYLSLEEMKGGSFNNHAIFGGGLDEDDIESNQVFTFNSSLTGTLRSQMQSIREWHSFAATPSHAIFACGRMVDWNEGVEYWRTNSDAYDKSFTRTNGPVFPTAKCGMSGESFGEFALFLGGILKGATTATNTVHSVDASLTLTAQSNMTRSRNDGATSTIGDYLIIAGGFTTGSGITYAEAYKLEDA